MGVCWGKVWFSGCLVGESRVYWERVGFSGCLVGV